MVTTVGFCSIMVQRQTSCPKEKHESSKSELKVRNSRTRTIPILTSKFYSTCYHLRRRRGIGGLRGGPRRRRGVGGEIPLPSLFRPRTFRSEAAAHVDNRRIVVVRYGPLALSGQPMITQHWRPVLIAPGHFLPSRDTLDTWPAFV
jgi:hypothetical protein